VLIAVSVGLINESDYLVQPDNETRNKKYAKHNIQQKLKLRHSFRAAYSIFARTHCVLLVQVSNIEYSAPHQLRDSCS